MLIWILELILMYIHTNTHITNYIKYIHHFSITCIQQLIHIWLIIYDDILSITIYTILYDLYNISIHQRLGTAPAAARAASPDEARWLRSNLSSASASVSSINGSSAAHVAVISFASS